MNIKVLKAFSALTILFFVTGSKPSESPEVKITNGIINAKLYIPDADNGYYRGTRFDWSGVISSLEYSGHTYFGKWFEEYSPTNHDAIMGPADSFGPLDYDNTKPGETFVKIGVGILKRPDEKKFRSFTTYPIVDHGQWEVKNESSKIRFTHKLKHSKYSYEYVKTIELVEGKPEMLLTHVLKNTGNSVIETEVFNHNFFVIDNGAIGKSFELSFAQNVSGTGRGFGEIAEIKGNRIVFNRDLIKGESIHCKSLDGINNSAEDFDIKIDNLETGAGARITGDRSLSKLVVWGSSTTLCPETYLDIKVEPGEEIRWTYSYDFFTSDVSK